MSCSYEIARCVRDSNPARIAQLIDSRDVGSNEIPGDNIVARAGEVKKDAITSVSGNHIARSRAFAAYHVSGRTDKHSCQTIAAPCPARNVRADEISEHAGIRAAEEADAV